MVAGQTNPVVEYLDERPGDVLRLYANSGGASELLGFTPHVSLQEGLEKLKTWYQQQDVSPEVLLEDEIVQNWEGRGRVLID